MTVGESLTEARCHAGLSINDLSERTRIRQTVIRSIERDDYEACGGDLYVRGYVRAIAGAVGIDAQPLIREYDLARAQQSGGASPKMDAGAMALDLPSVSEIPVPSGVPAGHLAVPERSEGLGNPADPIEATGSADSGPVDLADPLESARPEDEGSAGPERLADSTDSGEPAGPAVSEDTAVTRSDLPRVPADPAATRSDLPLVRESAGEDLMAAGYEMTAEETLAHGAVPVQGPRHRAPRDGRVLAPIAVALLLSVVGALGFHLATGMAQGRKAASSSVTRAAASATAGSGTAAPVTSPKPDSAAQPSAAPSTPAPPPVTTLSVVAVEAFGPEGLADGDNPQIASLVIQPDSPQYWSTQWYATAEFGMLKHGTGLLLDLGKRETITSAQVSLAPYQGASLQLRAGDGTVPSDFRVVASAQDVGGTVRLVLRRPASTRYLLIWFTLLPSDGAGHYDTAVYHVQVKGRR